MSAARTNTARSSDCLRDHFLLAMPGLTQGIFSQSITYICEHGEAGAMGIVINQPLELSLAEIFDHLEISCADSFRDSPVMAGGPVQIDHGFVLHRHSEKSWEASLKVAEEITLTTSRDILRAIAGDSGPKEHIIALGYAGWAAGQLEHELAENSWLTLPATSELIFYDGSDLWEKVAKQSGRETLRDMLDLKDMPDDPSMN